MSSKGIIAPIFFNGHLSFAGYRIKDSIFRSPINNLDQLYIKILEKIGEKNNTPQRLENAMRGVCHHVHLCIEAGGGHFNHLLQSIFILTTLLCTRGICSFKDWSEF